MKRILGGALIMIAVSSVAMAVAVPEIPAGSAAGAFALLSGGLLILRSRTKR